MKNAFAAVLLLLAASPALAGQRQDALRGRVSIDLPDGTRDVAHEAGVAAAPESADEETRFVLQEGSDQTVFLVQELFATNRADLTSAVKAMLGPQAGETEVAPLPESSGLKATLATPRSPRMEPSAEARVDALYVVLPDSDVVEVAVYLNRSALEHLATAQQRIRQVLGTVRVGSRPLPLGGTHQAGDLTVTLPGDAVMTNDTGPDFNLHRIHWMDPLGAKPGRSLGIYIGEHPQLFRTQHDPQAKWSEVDGTLFGRKAKWQAWNDGTMEFLELIEPLHREHAQPMAHVFITAAPGEDVAAVRRTAETIQVH